MIEDFQPVKTSPKNDSIQDPVMKKVDVESVPLIDSSSQLIEAVVSKYPATSLTGGFVLGGLLGWLLKR
jgi:hypothetical protein